MADFDAVESLSTLVTDCEPHRKTLLQLRVTGAPETLTVTCPSLEVAESLAHLVDGYFRFYTNSDTSLWNLKGKHTKLLRHTLTNTVRRQGTF